MLICSVSMRPPGRVIAAALAEAGTAVDALATGNIVFATLVDDPASVRDTADAYLGEIMLEAASAADSVSAGSAYAAAIDESMTAADTQDGTVAGALAPRDAMVMGVMVNSDGTVRDANVDGVMVNL